MKRIPIYDATAPIVCTIGEGEVAGRIEQLGRLRHGLELLERTEHGMLLHFPKRPEIERDLQQFAVDEKRCCQFWGFEVAATMSELVLRWDAPPDADGLVQRLVDWFEGDAPLDAIAGLL